ncbi:glycosyltransferase [Chromobacterium sp. IIBBL 290-4]|uniref:glycosyltransferase n=1 Tax=Chromobacterium sp. IIBBL 290-4 TaxID=2953890 RepID=UPI0020B79244|nr:glycosyltransferase [Chromobacterium sp. IIBBL 290-4]UTH73169.1 glycosyltransferase [Chromobacterium sp. IIBBL 290-4]
MSAPPLISVVIPTYNRSDLLRHTLSALSRQTLPKEAFEVVVVDDGGSDDSQAVVESFREQLDIKYFWQEDKGFRAGKARNIGTAIAEAPYIVYIDTGVLLARRALETHLTRHQEAEYPTVMVGYVYGFEVDPALDSQMSQWLDPDDADATIAKLETLGARDVRQSQYDELGENITHWPAPFDIFWTCHVSAERNELLKAGLFDETFNTWGGEDVDLGVRLFQNNNLFMLDKAACSFHWPHPKEVDNQRASSERAALRIHRKYNLWLTSFYGMDLNDEKYSLNKVIKIFRERGQTANRQGETA